MPLAGRMRRGHDARRVLSKGLFRDCMNEPLNDLLSRSALGDRGAFAQLYELASPKLYGIAMRLLKQRQQADDALQEAFSKIWYRAGSYRPDLGNPMTWMTAILRNQALDMLAHRGAHGAEHVFAGKMLLHLRISISH